VGNRPVQEVKFLNTSMEVGQ